MILGVGEMVVGSGGSTVGRIVAGGIEVKVGDGEGVAVAGTQVVKKASRAQVSNKRRCISKLYP